MEFLKSYIHNFRKEKALKAFENEMLHIITFGVLIILASGIASLGLIRGNIAVVIGAMIITPLVNPLVGVGLSVAIGRPSLFKKSLLRSVVGVAIFWGFAFLMGRLFGDYLTDYSLIKAIDIDAPEILIAIFAGTVAALALASEKIYNMLSGAAISLSIAPPLAVSAIGMAIGKPLVCFSGLVLFGINAVGLMVVSFIIFCIFGFRDNTAKKLQ